MNTQVAKGNKMNYRSDQIFNSLTTEPSYKMQITNSNSSTKWLNLTRQEVLAIENVLALIELNATNNTIRSN